MNPNILLTFSINLLVLCLSTADTHAQKHTHGHTDTDAHPVPDTVYFNLEIHITEVNQQSSILWWKTAVVVFSSPSQRTHSATRAKGGKRPSCREQWLVPSNGQLKHTRTHKWRPWERRIYVLAHTKQPVNGRFNQPCNPLGKGQKTNNREK